MRIACLGMMHETNTFQTVPTTYEAFERFELLRGDEITAQHATANSTISGFFEGANRYEFDLVPLLHAFTGPTGTVTRDAFDRIVGEMIDMLRAAGPFDGILLGQHGAAVSEEFPDMDGEIASRVRQVGGTDTPVVMCLDLHSNITRAMVENVDATVVYRTNPHLDPKARAVEASEILVQTIRGDIKPVQWIEQLPMVINISKQATELEPMKSVMDDVRSVIERPGIISASCGQGYPYADVVEMGVSFIVISDGDIDVARDAAQWLAGRVWERRALFGNDTPSPSEALAAAINAPTGDGPSVIMDMGDNVGGGGSADSTHLLAEAQRQGASELLMSLFDPESVQTCIAAGPGTDVTLKVGGKTDDLHGVPIEVSGRVRAITDGRFEEPTPIHGGFRFFDYGPTVALDLAPTGGLGDRNTLLLHTERGIGNMTREQMYSIGIFPERYRIVIAKGVVSPRAAYEPIAREIILANTPGVSSADLGTFNFEHRRRPLYPFEEDADYRPGEVSL
ncbi:MAG: M81 family metallopeptidase [Dehalococcoidia bacterium]